MKSRGVSPALSKMEGVPERNLREASTCTQSICLPGIAIHGVAYEGLPFPVFILALFHPRAILHDSCKWEPILRKRLHGAPLENSASRGVMHRSPGKNT